MSATRFRLLLAVGIAVARLAPAQEPSASPASSDVRVTVSMNQDGSRTVYEFDPANHKATATTTAKDGKPAGKIRYVLDVDGRFATGEVLGADGKLRFTTSYKYDAAGRLIQEVQTPPDESQLHKIVYSYDPQGHQTGYAIYDVDGKLIAQTSRPGASAAASPAKRRGR